jgi:putative transposase
MAGTFTNLLFHIVFSTKNRIPLIEGIVARELHPYLGGIINNQGGVALEINGMSDHIHMLVKLRPSRSVSEIVREVKSCSAKWMNEKKWKFRKFGWQDGYAAFTVSRSQVKVVREYVREQQAHHQSRDFKTEYLDLLRKHEIEFDETKVFD